MRRIYKYVFKSVGFVAGPTSQPFSAVSNITRHFVCPLARLFVETSIGWVRTDITTILWISLCLVSNSGQQTDTYCTTYTTHMITKCGMWHNLSPKGTKTIPGDVFSFAPNHMFKWALNMGREGWEKNKKEVKKMPCSHEGSVA